MSSVFYESVAGNFYIRQLIRDSATLEQLEQLRHNKTKMINLYKHELRIIVVNTSISQFYVIVLTPSLSRLFTYCFPYHELM